MLSMDDYDFSNNSEGDVQEINSPKLYRSNGLLFKNGINDEPIL
jgi:hypothetical protein